MAQVLVPLAQGCEELEAVTVIDLLRRAGIVVVSAGLDERPVRASRGVLLLPDTTLEQVMKQDFDMIVLPGGQPGTNNLDADPRIHALIARMAAQGKYLAAICAAPRIFARMGLLQGRRATGFPGAIEGLQLAGVTSTGAVLEQDGKVITSRGPGTAMDFALHLISVLAGSEKRNEVEAGLMRG